MMPRRSSPAHLWLRQFLRRVDRVAADLNVFLLVVALGLATLDFTFLVTEKVVDNLPPITRISYDMPASQQ
jgi:hypothetical protein